MPSCAARDGSCSTEARSAEFDSTNLADLQAEVVEDASRQLNLLLTDNDRTQLQTKTMVLASSSAADAIVDYAGETQLDVALGGR